MRTITAVASCTIMCIGLYAQTPAKTAATGATTETLSNEERNIRAYIELLRTDVKRTKSQVMGEVMQLDAEDSSKFWPIYKDFEAELSKVGDRILATIKNYAENYDKMTDTVADRLANEVFTIERERGALKKKYYDRIKASMGGITAMRFLQIENQLERLVDLRLAAQLPVISESQGNQ